MNQKSDQLSADDAALMELLDRAAKETQREGKWAKTWATTKDVALLRHHGATVIRDSVEGGGETRSMLLMFEGFLFVHASFAVTDSYVGDFAGLPC